MPIFDEKDLSHNAKKIEFEITAENCWECTSHYKRRGYPIIFRGGRKQSLHRYTYEQIFGEISEGLVLLHKCDNPSCFNPHHMKLGTQKENMKDKIEKGRGFVPRRMPDGEYVMSALEVVSVNWGRIKG